MATFGVGGFVAGVTVVFIDRGHLFHYPLHFITGLLTVLLIITTVIISRGIRSTESKMRSLHLVLGVIILSFYVIQILLGIGIIFKIFNSH